MDNEQKYKIVMIFVLAIFVFLLIPYVLLNNITISIISIIFLVLLFYLDSFISVQKHERNQKKLLYSLLNEIETSLEHLKWIKEKRITYHFSHNIDANFYVRSLDSKIDGKETKDLTPLLRKVEDKINLVNFYVKEMLDYVFNKHKEQARFTKPYRRWKEEIEENLVWYDNSMKDKFLKFVDEYLDSPIEEANIALTKLQERLKERWGIESSTSC
jgi:hypothetical protein